mmetsp:Transcript_3984/g.7954  ORF Transcript_3984/g.7954 Transcript_3984/m.7954 type:complete len:179 (-) Transcript_3984:106-642(-)
MSSEDDVKIKLVSRDDVEFHLPLKAAKLSRFVCNSLSLDEDGQLPAEDEENKEDLKVDVIRVSGGCLEKVVDFMTHHADEAMQEITMPLPGPTFEDCMPQEWYRGFVAQIEREMLFELLTAANYMDIKPLLDLACLRVTFELSQKTAEEIRTYLELPELTPEEEARARENHPWIFEEN